MKDGCGKPSRFVSLVLRVIPKTHSSAWSSVLEITYSKPRIYEPQCGGKKKKKKKKKTVKL
jgi:hypothetical protein